MNEAYELLLWVPEYETIIYCQDGSGDQLDEDDYEQGYNDYIDYSYSKMDGDNYFVPEDGGLYLYNNDFVESWQDKLDDFVCYVFDIDEPPRYVKLMLEME